MEKRIAAAVWLSMMSVNCFAESTELFRSTKEIPVLEQKLNERTGVALFRKGVGEISQEKVRDIQGLFEQYIASTDVERVLGTVSADSVQIRAKADEKYPLDFSLNYFKDRVYRNLCLRSISKYSVNDRPYYNALIVPCEDKEGHVAAHVLTISKETLEVQTNESGFVLKSFVSINGDVDSSSEYWPADISEEKIVMPGFINDTVEPDELLNRYFMQQGLSPVIKKQLP